MSKAIINIAKDYSQFPAGRFYSDGPFSGEKFREEVLTPAIKHHDQVEVIIDGVSGYGSSFLEEGFGGLIRSTNLSADVLKKKLTISYDDIAFELYSKAIWEYIQSAQK